MEALGRIASPRGVQVLAVDSMLNFRPENQFTTTLRFFSYLPRIPADGAMSVDGRPFRTTRHLNFFTPGVPLATRGNGPVTGALCILSPDFISGLSETEGGLPIEEVDFLTSIESKRLAYLGQAMLREAIEPGFGGALFAEAMGMAVVVEIARLDGRGGLDDEPRRGGLAPWQMRRLDSYVRDHLSDKLTLRELAMLIGVSIRQLSHAIKVVEGVSLRDWVAERRLAEGRRLLIETDLPIGEVGRRCSFRSSAAFAAAFRAAIGCAPGEFRRLTSGQS
jgi:AraC family transcriptional regulator